MIGTAANYLPYEPQQMLLLPETLQEWLPEAFARAERGDRWSRFIVAERHRKSASQHVGLGHVVPRQPVLREQLEGRADRR